MCESYEKKKFIGIAGREKKVGTLFESVMRVESIVRIRELEEGACYG